MGVNIKNYIVLSLGYVLAAYGQVFIFGLDEISFVKYARKLANNKDYGILQVISLTIFYLTYRHLRI